MLNLRILDYEKAGSFKGVVWGFSIVFFPLLQLVFLHVRLLNWG